MFGVKWGHESCALSGGGDAWTRIGATGVSRRLMVEVAGTDGVGVVVQGLWLAGQC